jgi:ABC-type iron transport system FetAB ATPase subunit
MLVIEDLRRPGFGPFSLSVASGTCCAVTGPSGSGKSVLLRMVADLDPCEGSVSLDGVDRDSLPAPHWRRRVTYLAAESGWWADRVGDHFPAPGPDFARTCEMLRLPSGVLDWPVSRLSTGERQRLAFLRGLAGTPRVLLLDEPTAALDPEATAGVEAILRERLTSGMTVLLVSHSADQVARLAGAIYPIAEGRPAQAMP